MWVHLVSIMPRVVGKGLVNSLINKLPVELHLPGYQFCGPGTKLAKRLSRGDRGINKLDSFCREHDIAYSQNKSLEERHKADRELENRAWERVKSDDAKFGEKAAAWLVTNTMKAKRKLGMGVKPVSFKRDIVKKVERSLKKALTSSQLNDKKYLKSASLAALKAARVAVKKAGGKKNVKVPRIIPVPKTGGFLPLLPLLGALGALGSVAGGAGAVAKTIIDAKDAKKRLEEQKRHNRAMEAIGKEGSGLYLRKSKNGVGLFLKKQKNSH